MNKNSSQRQSTVVKVFINTVAILSLISSSASLAARNDDEEKKDKKESAFVDTQKGQEIDNANRRCQRAEERVYQARTKIKEACRKAGLPGGTDGCLKAAENCAGTSGEESFDTTAILVSALGLPAGSTSGSSACPQMSGRDYFTEKDKLQKDIKDTEKDLAELNDDKAKLQDDYNKEMQDIQEALTKAQEDLKEKNLDLEQKDRERQAEFQNSQNQAKEELRKKGADILRLRGQLIQSQRDKALKMIAMTDASGKRACMKAVRDAKKAYDNVSSASSSNHLAQAKQKKEELINTYNDCMEAFDQQRVALNESKKQEQDQINQQIDDLQSSVDEIQNSLNLASTQLEEIKQAAATKKNDALQSVIDLGTRSQNKMQAAYTKLQENLKTLAAKSASLQAALNRANASMMTLGPAPKSRSSDYAPSDASSEIAGEIEIIEDARRGVTKDSCPGIFERDVAKKDARSTKGRR